MSNNNKTPAIRFKGFTDTWEQRKLNDVGVVIDPHPSHRAPAEENGGIPFIGIGDVDEMGNINRETARLVSENVYDEHHRRYDLCVPSLGLGRVASLGKVIRLRSDIGKYAISPTMSVLQFNEMIDIDYMYAFMNSSGFKKQFEGKSNGSTRQSVGTEMVRLLDLDIPSSLEEQKAIGAFYKSLDNLITLHQRKCDKLIQFKAAMLQKMFPQNGADKPKIRFKGFTDAWEQRKLGECSELITKGTTPSYFSKNGSVFFVKIEALKDKYVIKELCSTISEEIHTGELARSILKENDLVFAIAGATVGKCAVITKDILPANTNQALAIVRLKQGINIDFIYLSLTSEQMATYIQLSKSVGAQPNLSLAQMNAFVFSCPSNTDEQTKIGKLFSDFDSLITLHQRKCEKYKSIKAGLIRKLFP